MQKFDKIIAIAAKRNGGNSALEKILAQSRSLKPKAIAAALDDRILSAMTRCVFHAGFNWNVVDGKWSGFEDAFDQFDPHSCASITGDHFDELLKDKRIVRNGAKIQSVIGNAQFVLDLAAKHGTASKFFADWPNDNYVGLLDLLKMRAKRLGGQAGMYFLRSIGKPAFITTTDMTAALIREGVIDKEPSGKRDFAAIQNAYNRWSAESGRDHTEISRILALSVGPEFKRNA